MTDPDPTDADIEELLNGVTSEQWRAIWEAAAALDADEHPSEWAGGERSTIVVDGVERTVTQVPYVRYGDAALGLLRALATAGLIVPFNWPDWDGTARYARGEGLERAPVADAVRLATTVARADRFAEGTLKTAIDDGTLSAVIRRLRRWHDDHA